ncbi:MAG TPA: MFS transporter [Bryobacteraceae bacterium]
MATYIAEAVTENRLRYPGWGVALASSTCVFVSFASIFVYTFGIFLKPLALEFDWSREAVSAAFGFAALSVAVCSPVLGVLLDRLPARRIILPSFVVFGCALASLSLLTDHLWHLYLIFVVIGIVGNGTAHLAYSHVLSAWFDARRGAAFALLLSGGALGAMVFPLVAQTLINAFDWRNAFAILGGIALAVGLSLGSRVRESPNRKYWQSRRAAVPAEGSSVRQALRSRAFWIILTVLFLSSITQNGAIAHLPALLTDRGISSEDAALAASILGGATLGGRLFTGWLIDRCFAPRVAASIIAVAACGTLILSHARSLHMGILGAVCIGLGMGGEADITPYLLSRYFGLRSLSTLYGWSWTAYAIAGAIGPVIMGKAFDLTGSYQTMLAGLAVSSAVAAALMLMLPRYSSKPVVEQVSTSDLAPGAGV